MKGFAKIILGALAALVILFVVALVGINLYLQSGDVQQRIRLATEQALGLPVTVKRTLYTPWGGLTLSGLSLPDPTIPNATLVDAPTFSVKFQFWPLLARKLVISQVHLSSPRLVLRQTSGGKWLLAAPRPRGADSAKPAAKPGFSGVRAPAYAVELRYFYIQDGSADIIDRKGAVLGRVRGLTIDGSFSEKHEVSGKIWIDDMEIVGFLHPNHLRAQFVQEGDMLTVSDLRSSVADGKVRGTLSVLTPRHAPPLFELRGEVVNVSLPTLVAEAQADNSGVTGLLVGNFKLRGNPLDAASLTGHGDFSLSAAQLRPFDVIQQVGMLLNVDELQLLKLREASLQFEIRDEKFVISPLRLKTDNLIITGRGPIKFNGRMNLDGRFLINEKIERQLSMIIGDQFAPVAEQPGYKGVTFRVTGQTSRPETDLPYKLTGFHIGNMGGVGNLLKGFFQAPKAAPPAPDQAAQQ